MVLFARLTCLLLTVALSKEQSHLLGRGVGEGRLLVSDLIPSWHPLQLTGCERDSSLYFCYGALEIPVSFALLKALP